MRIKRIFKSEICLNKWLNKEILYVGDLIDNSGSILSIEEINTKFNLSINFLEYFQVRLSVNKFISKNKKSDIFNYIKPVLPSHVKILFFTKKGSKKTYNIVNNNTEILHLKFKNKWSDDLNENITNQEWNLIFRRCFKTVSDNHLIWFQYRIIHRILGTRKLLYQMNIVPNPLCSICQTEPESLCHLFLQCPSTQSLWQNIEIWIKNKLNISVILTHKYKMLGYTIHDCQFLPLNTMILVAKYYIFKCSQNKTIPDIFQYQRKLKRVYEDQFLVSQLNFKDENFVDNWSVFAELFRD